MPRGCPPDFEFLPDLDTFYRDWLGRPLPDEVEFADKTLDAVRRLAHRLAMSRALDGIVVLDLTSRSGRRSAPRCSRTSAREVLRVEDARRGATARAATASARAGSLGLGAELAHRNKQSLAVDDSPPGRARDLRGAGRGGRTCSPTDRPLRELAERGWTTRRSRRCGPT